MPSRADAARLAGCATAICEGQHAGRARENAGIDAAGSKQTVREYNAGRERGRGPPVRPRHDLVQPLSGRSGAQAEPLRRADRQRAYYARQGHHGRSRHLRRHHDHGARAGAECSGSIIPGLYAVGNDRASIMGGNYPGAGITLGPNMTFGYITGRHLAGVTDAAGGLARTPGREAAVAG